VVKRLVPPSDPGRFNLFIDGQLPGGAFGSAQAVGDNGTTGFVSVAAGQHFVNEAGAMFVGPMEDHYTTTYSANCPGGYITLQPGASETCTITNIRKHGSWTQGPGTYTVTVCAPPATCTIPGTAGQSIEITFEVWGGGGGGGAGGPAYSGAPEDTQGGNGGGGGGGGGYGKTTITTTVPTAGTTAFHVNVGTGGAGGSVGGFSEVRSGSSGGTVVVKATGGAGGHSGDGHGGASGIGTLNNWAGLSGGNGSVVSGCNGGAGGAGGVGGGPGAINNGGDGGHGGYLHIIEWWATCTAQSMDGGLTSGAAGMNGLVKITW